MKRSLLVLVMATLFMCQSVVAQITVATNVRKDYDWNSSKKEWVLTSEDNTVNTLFEFNKDLTMVRHTTSTISSTYYIKSGKENTEQHYFEYEVVSDVGNKYTMIVDFPNNNIRFIGKYSNGTFFLVRHSIKKSWIEEG